MKVFVYFNLHKKCFSVKAMEGDDRGRVIAHRAKVYLVDAQFKVSEAGRQRVLREQRKNVHAGVMGTWIDDIPDSYAGQAVTYNPYKYSTFVLKDNEAPVDRAYNALLLDKKILAQVA
jgi:hypothetical protein